jgi:predicted AAA+ superfamily ATPase
MKTSEIRKAVEEQSEERGLHLGMPRDALGNVFCEEGFATIVTGVRRCGKSTLLKQWAESQEGRILSVHFDDLRLAAFETPDFALLDGVVRELGADTLILDEIQDIPEWERFVTGCLDMGRRILVTGSNARMLSREFGTKLTGRHLNTELYPFSYPEFLRFTDKKASPETLEEYLNTGGFPAYVRTRRREVLTELFNDILYRDIVVRYHLRDHVPIRSLAIYLLGHVGSRVSPSRLKDAMRVSSAGTMLEYFGYLEETYLVRRMPRYADSPRARLLFPKKVYACDTGLVSALSPTDGSDLGHKLENLVYLKLLGDGFPLSYFVHDGDNAECDFIQERRDGTFKAVQVAWVLTDENEAREFTGAIRAMERFGLDEAILVTRAQADRVNQSGKQIRIIPAHEFLTQMCGEELYSSFR